MMILIFNTSMLYNIIKKEIINKVDQNFALIYVKTKRSKLASTRQARSSKLDLFFV